MRFIHINTCQDIIFHSLILKKGYLSFFAYLSEDLYSIISENHGNGQVLRATFHIEKSLGLGGKTRITSALTDDIKNKFMDLIRGTSLEITLRKQGNDILNKAQFKDFIGNIVFYLVMFNAISFIGEKGSAYTLFASQMKIYNNEYIKGLYSRDELRSVRLSSDGYQIYNSWSNRWNQENGIPV